MTKAFNLSQLADKVNTSGQIDASTGLYNSAPNADEAGSLQTTNFTIAESGGKLMFYYGATAIASMDSSGNFTQLANVTAYGTP